MLTFYFFVYCVSNKLFSLIIDEFLYLSKKEVQKRMSTYLIFQFFDF